MKNVLFTTAFVLTFLCSSMVFAAMNATAAAEPTSIEEVEEEEIVEEEGEMEEEANLAAEDESESMAQSEPVAASVEEDVKEEMPAPVLLSENKAAPVAIRYVAPEPAPRTQPARQKPTTQKSSTAKQGATRTTAQKVMPTPEGTAPKPKSQKPTITFLMAETKAYELFRDGYYDEAAPYFMRMSNEKKATLTDAMKYEGVDNIVKHYIDVHLFKFLAKGEFEKTATYVNRVSEASRNKKIQALANTIFEELKQREKKVVNIRDFTLSRYYADEEAFQINSPYGVYIINVELANARNFKSSFFRMQIKDLDFTPDSGILKLSYFTLINPENSKSYPFISGLTTTYNAKDIEQFYTSRLGAGVPKATHVAIDSIGAMRSIKPLNATVKPKQRRANTEGDWKIGLKNATTPEAKITEEEDEVVLEN